MFIKDKAKIACRVSGIKRSDVEKNINPTFHRQEPTPCREGIQKTWYV